MTKEDIIRMANDAKLCAVKWVDDDDDMDVESLYYFASLVAAAEREECAKLCDKQANNLWQKNCDSEGHGADQCADAIRARGQK